MAGPASAVNGCLLKPWAKPLWFGLSMLPLVWLVWAAASDQLGANPAQVLVRSTGDWTLRSLCLVLALTPLRSLAGWSALARMRRMAGLFVFFYALLHALAYAWFDMGLEWAEVAVDIVKRPFILVGFLCLLLLLPLAATSTNRAVRALGGARWQRLHRLVYAVAVLAVLHFFWMRSGKHDYAEVFWYALLLGALLLWRVWRRWQRLSGR